MVASLVFVAALAAGCGDETPKMTVGYRVAVGGLTVEIWPKVEPSSLTPAADGGMVVSGATKVEVHNFRLTVNGVDYGLMQGGDDIIVNTKGNDVRVNGQVRAPGGGVAQPPAQP
jgi:hypothetical protein